MSCLAMGGIGCLVLLIAAFLGGGALVAKFAPGVMDKIKEYQKEAEANPEKAAAKLGIKMIPGAKIVKEEDAKKEITFTVGGTQEELTMSYDGINNGNKPVIKNSKGEIMGNQPGATAPAVKPAEDTPPPAAPN